jgi:allene oxide cyclase-like protein
MSRGVITTAVIAVLVALAGTLSAAAASPAAGPSAATSKTLAWKVVFSPPEFIQANNVRNPGSGFELGDEIVFHDQLFASGQKVGDEGGSCVIIDVRQLLANCTEVIRLQHGTITAQFLNAPPPTKQLAVTGGAGAYRNVGGDGTLIEFGNGKGTLTLHLLSLLARGEEAWNLFEHPGRSTGLGADSRMAHANHSWPITPLAAG